ncbi:hypothetical protein [Youxingia wuxianensis]|uniref:Uncharacterized protein n=1 Tax=Youxingia wuxianensis TaxID=2763678 RepID=A0A926ICC3_9FIRM|nr:hypothetical protein [Youxingia wuxianensis]MBC8585042.1 hypothetical protein [Youxingia wuxianensis]
MLKKINYFINILMGSFTGVFIGSAVFKYLDYKKNPDLYVMQSAPWYLSIQITGIALIIVLLICVVIKVILGNKLKR